MIVLEGPDGGGKSTLALALHRFLLWPTYGSEGPPKSQAEFRERLDRYHKFPDSVIFDRHPAISDPIYSRAFGRDTLVTYEDGCRLKSRGPFVVYCVSPTGDLGPQNNIHADTPQHVLKLEREHGNIKLLYEEYFRKNNPQAVYRWDRPVPRTLVQFMLRAREDENAGTSMVELDSGPGV
jgi:energy-coupling factor transporter ATP-binding protein EcfA2